MEIRDVHRLSSILQTSPAQIHVWLLTRSITYVFSRIKMLVFLSRYFMFSLLISVFVCAAASLLLAWLVGAHVSALCVTAGSVHESYYTLFTVSVLFIK